MSPDRYMQWAKRVVLWDGALPCAVIAVAPLSKLLFPHNDEIAVIAALIVICAAYLIRLAVGSTYFETHEHWPWQGVLFFLAILYLVFLDGLMFAMHLEAKLTSPADWLILLVLYGVYLAMMGLAFFPFKQLITEDAPAESLT